MKCPKCQSENPETSSFCADCGTQLISPEEAAVSHTETLETPLKELRRGTTFAERYEVIEELGKGGMGKVYRVEDKKIKEEVALKLIKPEISADKKTIERFNNELKFARKIAHRNVCKMYDLGEEDGTHYITMEYVPGEDLKSFIRRAGPLSAGKTIFIAKQVCDGLGEAHRIGVVHRDLKPQNVMIDKEGNVRIMDFGIARSLKTKGITGAGVMIGTPEYMSPEQTEAKEVDKRSDVYSLGVILYEMATGRLPFEGETPISIAMKHKSEAPRAPKELNAQIPEDLSRVILRCMEKEKVKRYQSAEEVRSELDKIEKGIPTTEIEVPKRKPLTSKEITVTIGLKKLLIPAAVVAAIIIAAVIVWQFLPQKEAIPIPTDKPTLAVVYFKNNTGDEGLDNWRSALSDLLIADLTQSKYIRVLSGDKIFDILSKLDQLEAKTYSSEVLKEIGARGKATHILQGGFSKAGDNFRINYILQEAGTLESIGSERVEGKGEESFHVMVDELTRKIKANFKLSAEEIASDIDRHVGEITTSSPEAFMYFSEGSKYYRKGNDLKAAEFFEKAVAVDPEFAMAYRNMAAAYSNAGYPTKWRENTKKALELIDRVSERERYRIQGDFYRGSEKTYDKAIEAFQKLLALYPDDWIGNNSLGVLYAGLEEWDKAIEYYGVNVRNRVEATQSYVNKALMYRAKGSYDKAREALEFYLENISDNAKIRARLANNHLCEGKYDLALAEVNKALSLDPVDYRIIDTKGNIFLLKGDLIKAEEEFKKLLESKEPAAQAYATFSVVCFYILKGQFEKAEKRLKIMAELARMIGEKVGEMQLRTLLSYIYYLSGSYEQSLEELDAIWKYTAEEERLGWQRGLLSAKGLTYLEMNSLDQAQRTAAELKEMIEKGLNRKEIRDYYHLMGRIELKKKKFSKAIEYSKKAVSLLPYQRSFASDGHAQYIELLALAYYESGNLDKAQEEYERIISLTTGRFLLGNIYAKSFYILGKIYEQKGWEGKAIEHYQNFLDLWKDADPGFPEVEDAQKRLASLQE